MIILFDALFSCLGLIHAQDVLAGLYVYTGKYIDHQLKISFGACDNTNGWYVALGRAIHRNYLSVCVIFN